MNQQLANQQQDWGRQIVGFAARQGIKTRVTRAVRSSQVLTYCLGMYEPGQLARLLKMDEGMALALGVESVRLGRTLGEVTAEISLPGRLFSPLPLASLQAGRGSGVALGRSILNRQVGLDLADDGTPHALIAGTTGSGKSVLMRTIVAQLARQMTPAQMGLLLVDGKNRALLPFADLPHLVHPLITDPSEAAAALAWAVAEMDRRKGQPGEDHALLVVVVDEIAEILIPNGGKDGPAAECLRRLAAVGRELGIHVLLSTQYPNSDVLGGALAKANLPTRLAGHVTDAGASALATGMPGLAANRLAGKGDFLLVAGGNVQRLQVAQPSERDLADLPHGPHGELDLGSVTPDGALAATANTPDPLTPQQVAWCLAHETPGIGSIKAELGIGSTKAGRLQRYAREIEAALAGYGCAVFGLATEDDSDG